MARTNRKEPYKYWRKEKKEQRKRHYKKIRKAVKDALQKGLEPVPQAYRTEGYLTH
jgi:hypothetical protein